jgi:hypothetical protein
METTKSNELWFIFLFCLIGTLLTLPSFFSDFYSGHNVSTHLLWSRHFAEQLWNGDPYPRWLMNMNDGLGSPAFYFYFPLPYFITSIFHAPFLHLGADGWLQLGLSCAAALSLSGVSCYVWLRTTVGQSAAALGALVYMLLPYHLLVDLYYRFAFTEFWTFVFMPLCLFFADRIRRNERFGVTGGAISYALLFLTHLPTVLIFSPFLLCYLFATGQPGKRTGPLLRLSCALVLGAGLSVFYWVPAILTQDNVSFVEMHRGEFYFGNNFLFSSIKAHPKHLELEEYLSFVSFSTLFTTVIGLVSWAIASNNQASRQKTAFWGVIVVCSFLMMTEVSSWLWHILPLLNRIQFPYRFNVLLTLAASTLVAFALSSLSTSKMGIPGRAWIVLICGFFLSQFFVIGITVYKRATDHWDAETQQVITQELAMRPEVPEYLPHWANTELFPVTSKHDQIRDFPEIKILEGEGIASVLSWKVKRIVLQINAISSLSLTIRHLYYPGWVADINPTGPRPRVFPSVNEGFLSVTAPAGSHRVVLTLKPGPTENLSYAITLTSAAIWFFLLFGAILHGRKKADRS